MATTTEQAKLSDPVFAERYRAMSSRDARFDGQFITGVHTTGIYCRPSCPAVTPHAANVSFYLTAAAAHEAGLRACKRCLPDAVPGSPEWNIRDDLAARAMRLIADGTVERDGVPGLANHLGYTPRHLSRVLTAELGAGPLALARAHRAQTARLLLTQTDLPITDVAFAAGFSSVRQFNETVATIYETTPGAIRDAKRRPPSAGIMMADGSDAAGDAAVITLRLPARAPFDATSLFRFLAARTVAGVESGDATGYSRSLSLPHGPATVDVRPGTAASGEGAASSLLCEARLTDVADLAPLVARIRRLFDLDADARAIDDALAGDPALQASVRANPGLRVPGSVSADEIVFRALIGQQVSVAGARTALARLADELGERLDNGPFTRLFPTAERIAERGRTVLRGPRRRVDTIIDVAERLTSGSLRLDVGDSRQELEAALSEIPGIGPWTAGYVAMRVLGSPDILLTSDLVIRQGAEKLGLPSSERGLAARGVVWAPWRSYAGMHLWRAARA